MVMPNSIVELPQPTTDNPDIVCIVCCLTKYSSNDELRSLCGSVFDNFTEPDSNDIDCIICEDLSLNGFCPLSKDHKCPY